MNTDWTPAAMPSALAGACILSRYDAACRAVADARTVDDVQGITAQAEAVRAYARQAKNRQLEIDAAEIRIRAERRLGELMQQQAATLGLAKPPSGKGQHKTDRRVFSQPDGPPTLADAGIDKNLAHRARTLAAVPQEKFEQLLDEKRHREDRRVVLDDPDFQAEADAAARDIEIERDERIALAGADALAAENASLAWQLETMTRRVSALVEEVSSLKYRVKMWRGRAEAAGWKAP